VSELMTAPDAFLYMKVGNHAGEGFDAILERKRKEREEAGFTFWGYGGSACHPLNQVQPFARHYLKSQGKIYLFMDPMDSNADPAVDPAKVYSANSRDWLPMPAGVNVTGSKYALVLGDIVPVDIELSLNEFTVGYGPSKGKAASDYLRARIDKGCLVRASAPIVGGNPVKRRLKFAAELIEPYAVILR
jgi:hypothetical protein